MPLTRTFQFSATSLQDYVDCPRRFQLRYVLQVTWPAPEAEPINEHERHGQLARDFHQLVYQHLLALPTDTLSASVQDPVLERWWQAYLVYAATFKDAQVIPEVSLSTPLAGYRLVAQYDAIVVIDENSDNPEQVDKIVSDNRPRYLIVDWKTYRRRPSRAWLAKRLQTRVYPVVLVQAGASLTNRVLSKSGGYIIEPEEVEMRYWLVEYPETPISFPYDKTDYRSDLDYLDALISEILERIERSGSGAESAVGSAAWPLTSDMHRCRFCNYRSLCDRGVGAGSLEEYMEDDNLYPLGADDTNLDFDLDWGQVQEIAY